METIPIVTPRWRTLNLATAILPEEAERLRQLAKYRNVLEVGAANGYSAIIMALAGARHVTSVDTHEVTWLGDTLSSMEQNLEAFGVKDKVRIIKDTSINAMTTLLLEGKKFDFIFLDGSAIIEENEEDLRLGLKLLKGKGVIARHDYGHPDYPGFKVLLDKWFPDGPTRLTNSLFEVCT